MQCTWSLKDVCKMLNVQSHRIQYVYSHRLVPEPRLQVAGRRVFTPQDVRRLATYFHVTLPVAEAAAPEPVGV
jgi:DNA-binding transcriptional MerR regulator